MGENAPKNAPKNAKMMVYRKRLIDHHTWCERQDPVPLAFTFPLAFLDI